MVETMELPRKPLPEVAGFQAFLRGRIWGFANTQGAPSGLREIWGLRVGAPAEAGGIGVIDGRSVLGRAWRGSGGPGRVSGGEPSVMRGSGHRKHLALRRADWCSAAALREWGPVDRRKRQLRRPRVELGGLLERRHKLCAAHGWKAAPKPVRSLAELLSDVAARAAQEGAGPRTGARSRRRPWTSRRTRQRATWTQPTRRANRDRAGGAPASSGGLRSTASPRASAGRVLAALCPVALGSRSRTAPGSSAFPAGPRGKAPSSYQDPAAFTRSCELCWPGTRAAPGPGPERAA